MATSVDFILGNVSSWQLGAMGSNQERLAEDLVAWFMGGSFDAFPSHVRTDLEQQFVSWLEDVNRQRPSRVPNEITDEPTKAEREGLTPLAITAADYPLRVAVTVGTTGFVEYERIRYSMLPTIIGIPGAFSI